MIINKMPITFLKATKTTRCAGFRHLAQNDFEGSSCDESVDLDDEPDMSEGQGMSMGM